MNFSNYVHINHSVKFLFKYLVTLKTLRNFLINSMENQIPTKEGMNLAGDLEDVTIPKPEINYAVDVSIEPNHECEIVEIKYDGQEIYKELYYSILN